MKACVSETLSTLGQHFGQLLELALTREVQVGAGWAVDRGSRVDSQGGGGGGAEALGQAGGSSDMSFLGDTLLRLLK